MAKYFRSSLFFLSCSSVLIFGCLKPVSEPSKAKATSALTDDDSQILKTVLLDLLDYEEFAPAARKKKGETEIVLFSTTGGYSGFIGQGQLDGEAYGDKEHAVSQEFGDELRRRNPVEPISIAEFKSPSPKIVVQDIAKWKAQRESSENSLETRHYVSAWLPGYSEDGQKAVFRASFGPTAHGATLTYMLVKKDGRWTVLWRNVGFYA